MIRPAHPDLRDAPPEGAPVARERILVVDDEPTIRLALTRFLRLRGYEPVGAESGEAALALLEESERDESAGGRGLALMLCDVRMPGMSGIEVARRALAARPALAVVMLTAVHDGPTIAAAFDVGARDYLVKPVELAELERTVGRALGRDPER